jgi:cyclophilin family peptidyl-prolyl cis-trans isomerase/HEAT repeat protein
MKPIAAIAALMIVMQAPRLPQTGGGLRSPAGVPEPIQVLNAERAWSSADSLWLFLNGDNIPRNVRDYAVRALGRVEDPQQVRTLLTLANVTPATQAGAITQSLYGFDPSRDPDLLSIVEQWMHVTATKGDTAEQRMLAAAAIAAPMSHIVYGTPEQVVDVQSILNSVVEYTVNSIRYGSQYAQAIRGLEALSRLNPRYIKFDDRLVRRLGNCVRNVGINDGPSARLYALLTLVNAGQLDADVERKALDDDDWQVRRAAMAMLAGAGVGLDDASTATLIRAGLNDHDSHVRYEAARAWGLHGATAEGCDPLADALKDDDPGVVIEASDLLGTLCLDNEEITTRIEEEAVTPPSVGPWQAQTHAFAALAKRSPDRAGVKMEAFATHLVWWVRMYAAFAAAGAKDVMHLEKLAYDDNDNVREAALNHLRAIDPERAERAVLAALDRSDVQLLRTAAIMVKEWPSNYRYVVPLVGALDRLTKLHSMSARDGRLALLDAIQRHARPDDHTLILPWLKDFDPIVASSAADVVFHLTGKAVKAEPALQAHIPTQPFANLDQCVVIDMSPGKPIHLHMDPVSAPIAVEQFLKLATIDRYYNDLTFHRIAPDFVIQGGSPNANEYSGAPAYLRDEIAGRNVRGAVGLSIRGRNTGDAQFFINLIDNPRLDGGYTVFAQVLGDDMSAVDRIQEGDVMRKIDLTPCPTTVSR